MKGFREQIDKRPKETSSSKKSKRELGRYPNYISSEESKLSKGDSGILSIEPTTMLLMKDKIMKTASKLGAQEYAYYVREHSEEDASAQEDDFKTRPAEIGTKDFCEGGRKLGQGEHSNENFENDLAYIEEENQELCRKASKKNPSGNLYFAEDELETKERETPSRKRLEDEINDLDMNISNEENGLLRSLEAVQAELIATRVAQSLKEAVCPQLSSRNEDPDSPLKASDLIIGQKLMEDDPYNYLGSSNLAVHHARCEEEKQRKTKEQSSRAQHTDNVANVSTELEKARSARNKQHSKRKDKIHGNDDDLSENSRGANSGTNNHTMTNSSLTRSAHEAQKKETCQPDRRLGNQSRSKLNRNTEEVDNDEEGIREQDNTPSNGANPDSIQSSLFPSHRPTGLLDKYKVIKTGKSIVKNQDTEAQVSNARLQNVSNGEVSNPVKEHNQAVQHSKKNRSKKGLQDEAVRYQKGGSSEEEEMRQIQPKMTPAAQDSYQPTSYESHPANPSDQPMSNQEKSSNALHLARNAHRKKNKFEISRPSDDATVTFQVGSLSSSNNHPPLRPSPGTKPQSNHQSLPDENSLQNQLNPTQTDPAESTFTALGPPSSTHSPPQPQPSSTHPNTHQLSQLEQDLKSSPTNQTRLIRQTDWKGGDKDDEDEESGNTEEIPGGQEGPAAQLRSTGPEGGQKVQRSGLSRGVVGLGAADGSAKIKNTGCRTGSEDEMRKGSGREGVGLGGGDRQEGGKRSKEDYSVKTEDDNEADNNDEENKMKLHPVATKQRRSTKEAGLDPELQQKRRNTVRSRPELEGEEQVIDASQKKKSKKKKKTNKDGVERKSKKEDSSNRDEERETYTEDISSRDVAARSHFDEIEPSSHNQKRWLVKEDG
jgi:hypothetical protein